MSGPPPPPYTATWRIDGLANDQQHWQTGWHLELEGAVAFDFVSVRALHQDLLIWSEPFFGDVMADAVVCSLSRLNVVGPTVSVGDELYLSSHGSRGAPVPSAVAVPVIQQVQAMGRGRNGRFWLPPPAFSDTDFGYELTPGAHSHYAAELATFFDGINAVATESFPSVRFCVLHRREAGAWLDEALVEPVDTWRIARRLGTQDRRMSSSRAA